MISDRYHPLITTFNGVTGWWICDGWANTEHSLALPFITEPCVNRDEAVALCELLNEEDADVE